MTIVMVTTFGGFPDPGVSQKHGTPRKRSDGIIVVLLFFVKMSLLKNMNIVGSRIREQAAAAESKQQNKKKLNNTISQAPR